MIITSIMPGFNRINRTGRILVYLNQLITLLSVITSWTKIIASTHYTKNAEMQFCMYALGGELLPQTPSSRHKLFSSDAWYSCTSNPGTTKVPPQSISQKKMQKCNFTSNHSWKKSSPEPPFRATHFSQAMEAQTGKSGSTEYRQYFYRIIIR